MSYTLPKPFSMEERIKFVVRYNNKLGLTIAESDRALYALEKDEILENGFPTKNTEWESINLRLTKDNLISENDKLRDSALNGGVTYRNIVFDSDTDQKINLLATYSRMTNEDTITWYGMNNAELLCNKEDLMNIGQLIIQLHSFCWAKNAEIKKQIEQAESVEQLGSIDINYTEATDDIINEDL